MKKYDKYDLVVVGGGSGGLATGKLAADLKAKVLLVDFVKPSPRGTEWGLGGTCVNVGCIPKKLYHSSGIVGDEIEKSREYGWKVIPDDFEEKKGKYHDWATLRKNITNYIKGLNFKYNGALMTKDVEYKNMFATFESKNKLKLTDSQGKEEFVTAKYVLLAMGGRPTYPTFKGAEHVISSDDIFHLEKDPKKTLCIGASYISLETAGFLRTLGKDVTVAVRSIVLRGFDRTCAQKIKDNLDKFHGVKFLQPYSPTGIEKLKNGRLKVSFVNNKKENKLPETLTEEFDTVIVAVGRTPCTKGIGLEKIGVKLNKKGKVIVDDVEQTSVDNIYALGDIIPHQELTPVAIQTGRLLALRLFGKSKVKMDYTIVPTTVFTPLEYGAIGMGEEEAIEKYGKKFIDVYEVEGTPLENELAYKYNAHKCYFKIITYKFDDDKIIGFHYLGPNAGEVTQGYAVAMKCGATKRDLDMTVGIHPTNSEKSTTMYELKTEDTGC